MNIMLVEDEPPIAKELERMIRSIEGKNLGSIVVLHTVDDALARLQTGSIDLCLLDLNLNGASGYDLLKAMVSHSFHTIVVSAHTERAIEAFEYGVLDFVPKPVSRERLKAALGKFKAAAQKHTTAVKYLVVNKKHMNLLLCVEEITLLEAEGYLTKIFCRDGRTELVEKSLTRLIQILPSNFLRVHRSFIVDRGQISGYRHKGGSSYELLLQNGLRVPMNPQAYRTLLESTDKLE